MKSNPSVQIPIEHALVTQELWRKERLSCRSSWVFFFFFCVCMCRVVALFLFVKHICDFVILVDKMLTLWLWRDLLEQFLTWSILELGGVLNVSSSVQRSVRKFDEISLVMETTSHVYQRSVRLAYVNTRMEARVTKICRRSIRHFI